MRVIGKPRRRVDGRAKVTGQTRFADDIVLPRMLHLKLLRSPHAHALIESLDISRAQAHPGVQLVLTGKDFPVTFGILPVTQDEYPLAPQHVRYVGDPVAGVVAGDEQTATAALDLIDVRYQPLEPISNPEDALARVLQMPASQIRVIATPNGGGFGGKTDICNHELVAAKAALVLGRPVKICLNREEVFYMHRGRHPVLMKFRTGVTKDGKLTGMHLQTLVDGGGYGSYGVASTFYTGALQTVTYELPRYQFEAARVFTNKPPCGPKRGHGTPQPRFGQEIQLDKIAERLAMDPAELRLGMLAKPNSLTANWLKIGSIGLEQCIRTVVERSDWN